jgi:hypothetical protein
MADILYIVIHCYKEEYYDMDKVIRSALDAR